MPLAHFRSRRGRVAKSWIRVTRGRLESRHAEEKGVDVSANARRSSPATCDPMIDNRSGSPSTSSRARRAGSGRQPLLLPPWHSCCAGGAGRQINTARSGSSTTNRPGRKRGPIRCAYHRVGRPGALGMLLARGLGGERQGHVSSARTIPRPIRCIRRSSRARGGRRGRPTFQFSSSLTNKKERSRGFRCVQLCIHVDNCRVILGPHGALFRLTPLLEKGGVVEGETPM